MAPELYGFTETDLDRQLSTHGIVEVGFLSLRKVLERLRATSSGSIGTQFVHIDDAMQRAWQSSTNNSASSSG